MNLEDLTPEHRAALIAALDRRSHEYIGPELYSLKLVHTAAVDGAPVSCLAPSGVIVAELLKGNRKASLEGYKEGFRASQHVHRNTKSDEITKLNNRIQSLVDESSETLSENRELRRAAALARDRLDVHMGDTDPSDESDPDLIAMQALSAALDKEPAQAPERWVAVEECGEFYQTEDRFILLDEHGVRRVGYHDGWSWCDDGTAGTKAQGFRPVMMRCRADGTPITIPEAS